MTTEEAIISLNPDSSTGAVAACAAHTCLSAAGQRQIDAERGAFAGCGLDAYEATGITDGLLHHRQAQAGTLSARLGGEKRIEYLRQDIRWNTAAVIAHFDQKVTTWIAGFIGRVNRTGSQFNGATIRHGIARIHHQIEQQPFELIGSDQHAPRLFTRLQCHRVPRARNVPQKRQLPGDNICGTNHPR